MTADLPADIAAVLAPLLPLSDEAVARMAAPGVLKASALWYASIGWPVFPLVPGGKTPLTRRGFKDASVDVDIVTRWWSATPEANIGTPTGALFDVIDIDAPDGFDTFARWLDWLKTTPDQLPPFIAIAHTGSGGRHLFAAASGRGNGASLGVGLDYRGRGGYVCVPPSRLTGGGTYSWITVPKGTT